MKIAIIGAGGLVGANLAQHLANHQEGDSRGSREVIALRRADLDITDSRAVKEWNRSARPDLIINCAVAQVDACERDPELAAAVNARGPQSLAEAAAETGAEILHFSTNYVFDGGTPGRSPYTIRDEPRPINVYGRTKLEGERAVENANPRAYIVRTSWVYGPGKETFLASVPRRLRAREPIEAIIDSYSSTTYVRDLVARVVEVIERGRYGVYHLVNDGVCSYAEFAEEAARLVGLSETEAGRLIVRVKEAEMKRPARRPAWTPLRCLLSSEIGLAPLRDWRQALAEYVNSD